MQGECPKGELKRNQREKREIGPALRNGSVLLETKAVIIGPNKNSKYSLKIFQLSGSTRLRRASVGMMARIEVDAFHREGIRFLL